MRTLRRPQMSSGMAPKGELPPTHHLSPPLIAEKQSCISLCSSVVSAALLAATPARAADMVPTGRRAVRGCRRSPADRCLAAAGHRQAGAARLLAVRRTRLELLSPATIAAAMAGGPFA